MAEGNFKRIWSMFGPGLLYAGAAVGVSHLVQSTRAGAEFGFVLILVVLAANFFKYPFFEFGPRYASATGKTLLYGYRSLGWWAVALFLILTLSTMFTIQAAVTVVTAGLVKYSLGISLADWMVSAMILAVTLVVLGIGRYKLLDNLMKVIIILLSITTLVALGTAFFANVDRDPGKMQIFDLSNADHVAFLIGLLGWMPAPLDISVWHSVWTLARKKETGKLPSLKQSKLDFHVGYWGTTALAMSFLALGALMLYGSNVELAASGAGFAQNLMDMYARSLGAWSVPIIAVAALTTMFSTTLTCLDAFPRVLSVSTEMIWPSVTKTIKGNGLYWIWIILVAVGAVVLLAVFGGSMKTMVGFATRMSFLTGPVIAGMNMLVIYGRTMPPEAKPGKFTSAITIMGMILLILFGVYYAWTLLPF